jgi:hypothetical protein
VLTRHRRGMLLKARLRLMGALGAARFNFKIVR